MRAARLIRRNPPDVVHSHGDDWPLLFSYRRRKIVRTFHGSGLGEALAGGSFLRRVNHLLLFGLELLARIRVPTRVAVGPDSHRMFACQWLVPPVLPTHPIPDDASDAPRRSRAIVFIGSFEGRKRGWLAQDAWRALRNIHPDVELRVVGAAADASNFDAGVRHMAGLSDLEVRHVLADSMVLLAPSTYEGFGIPVWEALCEGTPVVATANPGTVWQERRATGGVLLTDDENLAKAVGDLLGSPAMWTAASRQCRAGGQRISDLADPSRYLEIYRRVLDRE
jgi:glycosyltransferase involved in cell wall biosynthesis